MEYIRNAKKNDILLLQLDLDEKFLKFRKEELNNPQNSPLWIDPIFNLKFSPALDVVVFTISNENGKEQITYLQNLPHFSFCDAEKKNIQNESYGVLIGYNDIEGAIGASSEEYCFTFWKIPKNISKIISQKFYIKRFLHRNKSVSTLEIQEISDCFVIFKGNTNCGSSGGPILSSEGKLIGLNLGNYYDRESEEDSVGNDDLETFDVKSSLEKVENYDNKLPKNFNLGISIFHPSLKRYFGQDKVDNFEEEKKY